jgi:hypothetical protein
VEVGTGGVVVGTAGRVVVGTDGVALVVVAPTEAGTLWVAEAALAP